MGMEKRAETARKDGRHAARAGGAMPWHGGFSGQSSVEYALVVVGVFAVVACLGFMVHAFAEGPLGRVVLESLSHRLVRGVLDVAVF